ncbi:ABC transporter substrate-binding protein, partial [bacterium]
MRGMSKPARAAALFLAVLTSLLALSCGGGGEKARKSGEFIVGLEGSPSNLDPRYASDAHSVRIVPLIFGSLLAESPRGELLPDLAENYEAPDPLTHKITLKSGITFHDGSPLTSKDIAATYRFVMDPSNGSPMAGSLKALERIETPDEKTVIFRLKELFVSFPYQLRLGILPERLAVKKDLGEELIGCGPFRLEKIKSGEEISLVRNDFYFGGAPKLGSVRFRILQNATTRLLELKSGGIDLLQNAVPPYSVKFLEKEEGLSVIRAPGPSYQYLGFNFDDKILGNEKVRRAIAHAID